MGVSGDDAVVSAPKFKLTVLGVIEGRNTDKVKQRVSKALKMNSAQVDQLLLSRSPILQKPIDHQSAFKLKSGLQELGVDCRISPVPLVGLAERAESLSLHSTPEAKPSDRLAPVRSSARSVPMRSGKTSVRSGPSTKGAVSIWPIAALVVLVVVANWLFQPHSPNAIGQPQEVTQLASMLDSRAIE
jgi:hypothetical protein